jgi:hypothetical protein
MLAVAPSWIDQRSSPDASERTIENTRDRSASYAGQIEYSIIDCTDLEQLLTLGRRRFDHVVCTMALMDMVESEPLGAASGRPLNADFRGPKNN